MRVQRVSYAQWVTPDLPLYGNDHNRGDLAPCPENSCRISPVVPFGSGSVVMSSDFVSFVRALPKVELHGVDINWIFDAAGEHGVAAGAWSVDLIRKVAPDGPVGLSLAGKEDGVDRSDFAAVFAAARALGLHSVPHGRDSGALPRASISQNRAGRINRLIVSNAKSP